jgi:alpha-glucosidase
VVYEIYPRSFLDSNGDGEGDINGIRTKLSYLEDLGVDAIWIAPWFASPMADGGYDVSDYRDVDPRYGTIRDALALIEEAHERGIRVILDFVANHTSQDHPWFQAALSSPEGSTARARYLFRDGKGPDGSDPPNNWISVFGGPAWTRITDPDGSPGQWYMHTFAPEQPDLNWANDEVRSEFDDILRFWFDRGCDGFRVDAAPGLVKAAGFPNADYGGDERFLAAEWVDNPHWDVDEVHEIFRRWRRIADEYEGDRVFVAEAVVNGPLRLARYVAPGVLHAAFNFDFLQSPWDSGLREVIDETLTSHALVGSTPTWVLASHDEVRLATRYGRERTGSTHGSSTVAPPTDLALGTRRLRAAALLMLALPGSVYVYQGDELGLPGVADLPEETLQDPVWERSGHTDRGRDASRVPLPWTGVAPPFGFSPAPAVAEPWLPQPVSWADLTVEAQSRDPASTLNLHRQALRLRHTIRALQSDQFSWNHSDPAVLDFTRGQRLRCVVNLSGRELPLDQDWRIVLSSMAHDAATLPHDTAVWLEPLDPRSGRRDGTGPLT